MSFKIVIEENQGGEFKPVKAVNEKGIDVPLKLMKKDLKGKYEWPELGAILEEKEKDK